MELSREQDRACLAVAEWLRGPEQVFYLSGPAGSGKTTLARHMIEGVDGEVYFAAFTGKAAYVLRQKGAPATTIHKLIYLPRSKAATRLIELEEQLAKMTPEDPARPKLERLIAEEQENMRRPVFVLNAESVLKRAKLLVVDEVSMVDESMGKDILSFGCKVLVLGDPAQLPPIYGGGYFTARTPDFTLTEIHRQAKDSPVIRLATEIREEQRLPRLGAYGDSRVVDAMDAEMALRADQMLVGKNATRASFNRRVRQLRKMEGDLPNVGDKLVCLRNSMEHPLLNGSLWHVDETVSDVNQDTMILRVQDPEQTTVECLVHKQPFRGEKVPWWAEKNAENFDYGYALTTHKAQGSQWDDVLVYDEGRVFRDDRWRWLYTAVTRAAKRVTIVRT